MPKKRTPRPGFGPEQRERRVGGEPATTSIAVRAGAETGRRRRRRRREPGRRSVARAARSQPAAQQRGPGEDDQTLDARVRAARIAVSRSSAGTQRDADRQQRERAPAGVSRPDREERRTASATQTSRLTPITGPRRGMIWSMRSSRSATSATSSSPAEPIGGRSSRRGPRARSASRIVGARSVVEDVAVAAGRRGGQASRRSRHRRHP